MSMIPLGVGLVHGMGTTDNWVRHSDGLIINKRNMEMRLVISGKTELELRQRASSKWQFSIFDLEAPCILVH